MDLFVQQIITGISIGGIYALLAVGYALIYSIFDFSNFAFGCVMMISAFTCYYATQAELGLAIALVLSLIAGVALSLIIELVAYRPLRRRGTNRLFLMITGMGVDLAVTNSATVLLGANARSIEIREFNMDAIQIGNVYLSKLDIVALIVSLVTLLLLYLYISKTKTGLGIRASAYSTSTAGLMGINVNRVSFSIFFIAGIAAAIAGIFCGMKYAVNPTVGSIPATKAFIASAIGGLGSLPGAVVGGLLLGIIETLASGFISSVYRDLFSYGILIFVLLFVPQGLLGKQASEKI